MGRVGPTEPKQLARDLGNSVDPTEARKAVLGTCPLVTRSGRQLLQSWGAQATC
jgi:hypothetical protein